MCIYIYIYIQFSLHTKLPWSAKHVDIDLSDFPADLATSAWNAHLQGCFQPACNQKMTHHNDPAFSFTRWNNSFLSVPYKACSCFRNRHEVSCVDQAARVYGPSFLCKIWKKINHTRTLQDKILPAKSLLLNSNLPNSGFPSPDYDIIRSISTDSSSKHVCCLWEPWLATGENTHFQTGCNCWVLQAGRYHLRNAPRFTWCW